MKWIVEIHTEGTWENCSEHIFHESAIVEAEKIAKQNPKSLVIVKKSGGTPNVYGYGGQANDK